MNKFVFFGRVGICLANGILQDLWLILTQLRDDLNGAGIDANLKIASKSPFDFQSIEIIKDVNNIKS